MVWIAISSSKGSSQPRNQIQVSCVFCIGRQIFYHSTTREGQLQTFAVEGWLFTTEPLGNVRPFRQHSLKHGLPKQNAFSCVCVCVSHSILNYQYRTYCTLSALYYYLVQYWFVFHKVLLSSQTPGIMLVIPSECSQILLQFTLLCKTLMMHVQRRQWHPTPVLLPGKSYGRRRLVGCSSWCR